MSSCISISLQRVGAVTSTATREPDAVTGVSCSAVGGIVPAIEATEGIGASVSVLSIAAHVSHVCTPSIRHPYLEIEPEIIWVYPDWAVDNNVFSNTNWNVG